MNIATYNMHSHTDKCWQAIINACDPDIILAQETHDPKAFGNTVWHELIDHWGTAIWAKKGVIKELNVPECEGWVIGAELTSQSLPSGNNETLTVFNIHAQNESKVGNGYVNGIKGALEKIKDIRSEGNLVIGGDFNLSTINNEPDSSKALSRHERELINLLRTDFHLVSAWTLAHPKDKLPQTLRWRFHPEPLFHCDFLFVPEAWGGHITTCDVLSSGKWDTLSDHNPVVATFS